LMSPKNNPKSSFFKISSWSPRHYPIGPPARDRTTLGMNKKGSQLTALLIFLL
jgi:hypothetical protein